MNEYINREAATNVACNILWKMNNLSTSVMAKALNSIPAADVAPVRHGRWVEKGKYTFGIMYDCSLCENRILDNGHPWNYCPNCGAMMDGGADNG